MIKQLLVFLLILTGINTAGTPVSTTILPVKYILDPLLDKPAYCILSDAASPHTFELRPSDMQNLEGSQALFSIGQHMDEWSNHFDFVHNIALLPLIPDSLLIVDKHMHENDPDPHFWTDPLLVKALVPVIIDTLSRLFPGQKQMFTDRGQVFMARLDSLDKAIRTSLQQSEHKQAVLAQPFFRYFFSRYKIDLIGIVEPHPGIPPTPRELQNLISGISHNGKLIVFAQQQLSDRSARLVIESVNGRIVHLDPLGGMAGRMDYEGLIRYNTERIIQAFNE